MKHNYFNFKRLGDGYLITNDQGKYAFIDEESFIYLVEEHFDAIKGDVLGLLKENLFVFDENEAVFTEKAIIPYRDNRNYLFQASALHLFVMTNACNMACVYCQAQDSENKNKGKMSKECAHKAVDVALQSPCRELTFEFQGGEPLTNFETIKDIVEYSNENRGEHEISYTIVTNTLLLDESIISYVKQNNITISTSLDGDRNLHNSNRPTMSGKGTYDRVVENIKKLQEEGISIGAIQTTTRESLKNAKQIVDAYESNRLYHVFLRPLTPLGYAKEHWDSIGYSPEDFIDFYREALDYILEKNHQGIKLVEGHACIFLRKIIGGYSDNYMELRSPCGAAVGQIAYYYDGKVYTCDEGRMLAEMGMPDFCLGSVEDTYDELMNSDVCKVTCQASVLECLPNCCDCVYSPYCGVCPVINYALQGNIYDRESNGYRCRIYKGILDTLFDYIKSDESVMEIFKSWL